MISVWIDLIKVLNNYAHDILFVLCCIGW